MVGERRKLGPEALIRILAGELLRVEEEAVKANGSCDTSHFADTGR